MTLFVSLRTRKRLEKLIPGKRMMPMSDEAREVTRRLQNEADVSWEHQAARISELEVENHKLRVSHDELTKAWETQGKSIAALQSTGHAHWEMRNNLAADLKVKVTEIARLNVLLKAGQKLLRASLSVAADQVDEANAIASAAANDSAFWRAEAQRWSDRMRELENRAQHAVETLQGKVEAPEIEELRAMRKLEPLAPWIVTLSEPKVGA